ncbi:MAG TPA: hypothetical protein VIG71_12095 [Enteractinococcus sp.]
MDTKKSKIGLIVPPADGEVPPEAEAIFGNEIDFVAYGLGISQMDETNFRMALDHLEEAASELMNSNVDAISVMGTSLTFFEGRKGNHEIIKSLKRYAPGVPVTTMSNAIIHSLQQLEAREIAVLSAYDADMHSRLISFLREHGVLVTHSKNLGLLDIKDVHGLSQNVLEEVADEMVENSKDDSDALLISCGGLKTLDIVRRHKLFPVISSAVDGIENVVSLLSE